MIICRSLIFKKSLINQDFSFYLITWLFLTCLFIWYEKFPRTACLHSALWRISMYGLAAYFNKGSWYPLELAVFYDGSTDRANISLDILGLTKNTPYS